MCILKALLPLWLHCILNILQRFHYRTYLCLLVAIFSIISNFPIFTHFSNSRWTHRDALRCNSSEPELEVFITCSLLECHRHKSFTSKLQLCILQFSHQWLYHTFWWQALQIWNASIAIRLNWLSHNRFLLSNCHVCFNQAIQSSFNLWCIILLLC